MHAAGSAKRFCASTNFADGDDLVIRAELPGLNPDEDITASLADNTLHIEAERREDEESEAKGYVRRELRYGHLTRDLSLPDGITEANVSAKYSDGILEVRVALPAIESTTIPIERS
ncbi:MAG: Hsp20/alpha crystallin family protein [Nitriliruptoraceae bacterium]